ncbi:hypothetical protein SAMN02927924_00070 [Sphingobium faniae]|nr:hypothetical protein SAMN02927924_00070 [Sphingobium faniae]
MNDLKPNERQIRLLRSIVFAGAIERKSGSFPGYNGENLESDLCDLAIAGHILYDAWLTPTTAGEAAVAEWYSRSREHISQSERDEIIDHFNPLDIEVKRIAIAWQDADKRDDWDARMATIEALTALHAKLLHFVAIYSNILPRFGEFSQRLNQAMDAITKGETDYIASVLLPSYHTTWFEFHEDLLRTLDRERSPE